MLKMENNGLISKNKYLEKKYDDVLDSCHDNSFEFIEFKKLFEIIFSVK